MSPWHTRLLPQAPFNWAESPVYVTWLHGPPGVGKSAIAHSLVQHLDRDSLLAASFFFCRTDSRRNTEKSFVTTKSRTPSQTLYALLQKLSKTIPRSVLALCRPNSRP